MSVTKAVSTFERLFPYVLFLVVVLNVLTLCMQFLLTGEAEPATSNFTVFLVGYAWWTFARHER